MLINNIDNPNLVAKSRHHIDNGALEWVGLQTKITTKSQT